MSDAPVTWVAVPDEARGYDTNTMDIGAAGLTAARRRRVLQIIFVFVNLALVESHIPGTLWLVIGGIFWIALILIAASGSSLVCGTMCWVGAIQDFAEPLARSRVRIDPRWGRGVTLTLLLLWIPVGWLLWPHAAAHDRTPLDVDPTAWQNHLFGLGLALAIPVSVMLLGKRGICRFFCPFNSVVRVARRILDLANVPAKRPEPGCALERPTCGGCARAAAPPLYQQMEGHRE